MAASVSKAGPYYASGEIKFSDLRRDFRAQQRKQTSGGSETFDTDTASISAAELLRVTDTTIANPIVPDSTENSDIATSNDLKLSQFRNSIKYYYITQSGTDENFDIDAQTWNTNLDKNINKFMFIDGTCGSSDTGVPAASLTASCANMTIDISGLILGAAGLGGSSNGGTGEDGGSALFVDSEVENGEEIKILLNSTAQVYAGGGGGGGGIKGAQGSSGTCYNWQYYSANSGCEWCGSCGGGQQIGGCNGIQGCNCFIWCRNTLLAAAQCRRKKNSSKSGGEGGNGGSGGNGRGYNWQSPESLSGNAGSSGASGNCNGYDGTVSTPGTGATGKTGATGGNWGANGSSNSNTGSAGSAGSAIYGTNYSVIGASSDTIKGSYTAS